MFTHQTIERFLSEDVCKKIVDYSLSSHQLKVAKLITGQIDENHRKSNIAHINYDEVFSDLGNKIKNTISPFFNLKGLEIDSTFANTFQFTKYGEGDFYDWHKDNNDLGFDIKNKRYCSIVIQLNDGYIGGDLDMRLSDEIDDTVTFNKGIGNMFIFLSNIKHRVAPVKCGTRYSLVGWFYLKKNEEYKTSLI